MTSLSVVASQPAPGGQRDDVAGPFGGHLPPSYWPGPVASLLTELYVERSYYTKGA